MSKPIDFKGVIKPVNLEKDFVIVSREFAQDGTISPFTKAVILDVQSRSEDWETNAGTIMHNHGVGRDKARSVLSEGQASGYVYAHVVRNRKIQINSTEYHVSTCKRSLRDFVIENGWETPESYALGIQAPENRTPETKGLESYALGSYALALGGNERRDSTKEETQPNGETVDMSSEDSSTKDGNHGAKATTHGAKPSATKMVRKLQVERGRERNLGLKRPANTRKAYSERFEKFFDAYMANANGMEGTKSEAAIAYDDLSEEDQDAALAAIPAHRRKLAENNTKFKHACRYLSTGQFEAYAEEVQAASAPPSDQAIITAIVADLMDEAPSRIKGYGWAGFPALRQARPDLFHSAVEYAKTECFWKPRGDIVALVA